MRKNIEFVRFVDDYRIFAATFMEANRNLNYLIDALDKEGLFLNTSKTAMIDLQVPNPDDDSTNENSAEGKRQEFEPIDTDTLCSETAYNGLEICRQYIDDMPISLSPVTQREVIMRMAELGDRPALVSLRARYGHFPLPARRAIFYCWKFTDKVLPAERRAFMKTLNKTEADPLISREAGKLIAAGAAKA